jgi:3-oxoacyl-[acyl-carrier protein] reductase
MPESLGLGLAGKVVVITGANNPAGIGAATARACADHGARVFVTYLRLDPSDRGLSADTAAAAHEPGNAMYHALRTHSAQHLVEEAVAAGHTVVAHELDLRRGHAAATELFDAVEKQLGPADVLVNCAAHYAETDATESVSEQDFDETFRVNTRATLLLTQEFARRFRARHAAHGRVINLSTDAAQTFAGQVTYGASKAAIEALTRSGAVELGPAGITVNAVAPGPVQTSYISPDDEQRLRPQIPLGRIGRPEDIARVIVFLASEHAGWITGQVLRVDGGHSL